MRSSYGATLVASCLLLSPRAAAGEAPPLTLEAALALARDRAPAVIAARGRVAEARGRREGASVLVAEDPVLEGAAGVRRSEGTSALELEVGVEQSFELGGQRRARIDRADAEVLGAEAARDDAARAALGEVASAFARALHARERVRLASEEEALAEALAHTAARLLAAGDVGVLDTHLAAAARARARAGAAAAEAEAEEALGRLRILLGLAPGALEVEGALIERRRLELAALLARVRERPDVRALEAEATAAEADLALGDALRWPNVGVGVRYAREEDADVVLGALSVTLPIFDRAAGARSEAAARARRLRAESEAARRAAEVEVTTAHAVYEARLRAVDALEGGALPSLREAAAIARKSYDAGQVGIADLLSVRREILDGRREHLDRQLEAALAGVAVLASAGELQ